jgi:uncharacterized protein
VNEKIPSEGLIPTVPTLDELRLHREAILAVAAQYGASNVRVIGSVARGQATSSSDIDFFVTFAPWVSLYELVGMQQALESLLGRPVDVVEDHSGLRERFRSRIEKEVILL